jgi:hypothetical protein
MLPTAELLVVETTRSAACPKQRSTKRYRRERNTMGELAKQQNNNKTSCGEIGTRSLNVLRKSFACLPDSTIISASRGRPRPTTESAASRIRSMSPCGCLMLL